MWAYERLIQSDLPDSASALNFLEAYFPKRLRAGYKQHYIEHPLKREIIATSAINYVINNGGVSLIPKLMRSGNPDVGDAIGAYLAADLKMNGNASRRRILESGLSAEAEHQALLELEDSLFTTCQK
jgi:glutamate dehydrogenase